MKQTLLLRLVRDLASVLNPLSEGEVKVWDELQAKDLSFVDFTDELAEYYDANPSDSSVSFNVLEERVRGNDAILDVEFCIDLEDSLTFLYLTAQERSREDISSVRISEVCIKRFPVKGASDGESYSIYHIEDEDSAARAYEAYIDAASSVDLPAADNLLLRETFNLVIKSEYMDAHASHTLRLLQALLLTDYIAAPAEEVPSEIIPHEPTLS